jgi:hypothetical protein
MFTIEQSWVGDRWFDYGMFIKHHGGGPRLGLAHLLPPQAAWNGFKIICLPHVVPENECSCAACLWLCR